MSFVSYAQNFEDVLLWRALGHVTAGFYIDVGANDPVEHSVTKAFYDAGWRGINIEPLASFHALFMEQRARDINLAVAAGAEEGDVVLFDVPAVNGWASSSPDVAAMHRGEGYEVVEQRVPLRTLDSIWQEHVTGPVHFLKIDVEGFEKQVLEGLDLAVRRPWVLVVEATTPNSRETNYDTWEHLVTVHGYVFAYFDGLNRYYVATEHASLLPVLQVQANVFDDAITARLYDSLNDNAALRARIEALETSAVATVEGLAPPGAIAALQATTAQLEKRLAGTDAAMTELWNNALPSITHQQTGLEHQIRSMRTEWEAQAQQHAALVEQRLRDALSALEQQVAVRLAAAEARDAERAAHTTALEQHMRSAIAALDEQISQHAAASEQRDVARHALRKEQVAALEERILARMTTLDEQLVHLDRRVASIDTDMHAAGQVHDGRSRALESQWACIEQRLASAEEVMVQAIRRAEYAELATEQANGRAGDAELATAASANRVELAEQRAVQLDQQVNALLASSSWRMTAPWRLVGGVVRRTSAAAREGRLRSGLHRRAVYLILGPAGPHPERGLRGWMRHAARIQWLRKIVLPAMQRNPGLNGRLRRLAGITPTPAAAPPETGELFLPEWPGPLPIEYLMMPASSRAVLLDLARGGLPPPQSTSPLSS
jgi:FkbM family methyltransferase